MDAYRPISPPIERGARGHDLPAYVSNGLIGLRIRENPLQAGMCIISGFVGDHHERRVEAAVAAPYPLGGDIGLDGLWASDFPETTTLTDQAYDFETAELTSRFDVHLAGRIAAVEVVTFASRTHPTIVCQELTVVADGACDLHVRHRLDTRDLRGRLVERLTDTPGEDPPVCDGSILWESEGALGRCGLALSTRVQHEADRSQEPWDELGPLSTTYRQRAAKGRPVRFRTLVSLVPDVMHHQPQRQAVRLVAAAAELGFDELRRRNRRAWSDLWRGRIRLVGAEKRWQAMADAAFFYLTTSVHQASPSSTSIFGLATWRDYHYYFGHVMWDIDAFAIPVLNVLQPDAARKLLWFRTRTVEAARLNAQLHGRRGLQFPWEAGPCRGEETAPGAASASSREDHINLHVALAFLHHAHASGDPQFLRTEVWPVISGVAEWITSRVSRSRQGYAIRDGGGPAERAQTDDNDAATLIGARLVLERAADLADDLGWSSGNWRTVAAGLNPVVRSDGVIAAHEGYRSDEEKGATPSPLMALFPFWADIDPDVAARTLRFYLDLWPGYVGAPMLAALYPTWAAWAGDRDLALKLMDEGYGLYQSGRFQQTLEYRLDKVPGGVAAGPFVANIGGFLTGLLFGLPGVRVSAGEPDSWPCRPVVLPAGWRAIECDQLWLRGEAFRLRARQGDDRAELTPAGRPSP